MRCRTRLLFQNKIFSEFSWNIIFCSILFDQLAFFKFCYHALISSWVVIEKKCHVQGWINFICKYPFSEIKFRHYFGLTSCYDIFFFLSSRNAEKSKGKLPCILFLCTFFRPFLFTVGHAYHRKLSHQRRSINQFMLSIKIFHSI